MPNKNIKSPSKTQSLFMRPLVFLIRAVAFLPLVIIKSLGRLIGLILYRLKVRSSIVEANLFYCFPNMSRDERTALCRAHYKSLGEGLFEISSAWFKKSYSSADSHAIEGLSHYTKAQQTGKSIVFLGYHSTHLELALVQLSKHIDFTFFYRPNTNQTINAFIQKGRESHYSCLARTKGLAKGNLHAITESLNSGQNLLFLPDQDFALENTCFASLFDKPIASLKSPVQIASLTDSIVLPISYFKNNQGVMQLSVLPELNFSNDDIFNCDLINLAQQKAIEQAPEQYYWVHRRFKTLPQGYPSIYLNKRLKVKHISAEQHDNYLYKGKILARLNGLPKLVRTADNTIYNNFARRTSFGLDITLQELKRMLDKINQFNFRGFYSISPDELTYCSERQSYILHYKELAGVSLAAIPDSQHEPLSILLGNWLRQLHRQGISLQVVAISNIQLLTNRSFALLNPMQCKFSNGSIKPQAAQKDIDELFSKISFLSEQKYKALFDKHYSAI